MRRALVLWAIAWLLGPAEWVRGQEPPAGAPAPRGPPAEPARAGGRRRGAARRGRGDGPQLRGRRHPRGDPQPRDGALGINYTIDPRIEGQVTIRTTGKIAREDLFPLFNQILRNNGIAAVRVGEIYQILPVAEAKTRAIVPRRRRPARRPRPKTPSSSRSSRCSTSRPRRWRTSSSRSSRRAATCSRIRARTSVVVTDIDSNVQRLRDLAATFDVDGFRNLQARVFKVKHGDPEELANELLGAARALRRVGDGERRGGCRIVPLVAPELARRVRHRPRRRSTEVERWLKILDIPPEEGAGRQTFVYNVENAKAVDLADVLNELFGGGAGAAARVGSAALRARPPAGVGLFGAGGVAGGGAGGLAGGGRGRATRRRGGAGGGAGGGPAGGGFGQRRATQAGAAATGRRGWRWRRRGRPPAAVSLGGGRSRPVPAAPGGVAVRRRGRQARPGAGGRCRAACRSPGGAPGRRPDGAAGPPRIFKEEVRIVADEVTNSLVILATKRDYQLILDVLQAHRRRAAPGRARGDDRRGRRSTRTSQFGVAYALAAGRLEQARRGRNGRRTPRTTATTTDTGTDHGRHDDLLARLERGRAAASSAMRAASRPRARSPSSRDKDHFQIFINALQARTSVKMLSAPHIIAADNREAHILVGESIPILTSTSRTTLTSDTAAPVNSVQYRDTGKILTVLPQVNSQGLVNMQIRQEVSAVGAASFGSTNSPSFTTREAETTVVVQDGDSVLIGGIIDDAVTPRRDGIPFLMDIPVLGAFFRDDRNGATRTELLVLITPYVIRNREEAREVTGAFSENVKGLKVFSRKLQERRAIRRLRPPDPASRPTAAPPDAAPAAEPAAPVPAEAMP